MQVREVDNLKKLLVASKIIGVGTTAICFLMKDGNVLKYYLNTYNKKCLFENKDMIEFLTQLEELENTTYHPPKEILVKNDNVVGYIYPYVNAKTLHTSIGRIKLFDILNYYDKLLYDTKKISTKNFILGDLHSKNILYNGKLNIIDLDQGFFNKLEIEDYFKKNINYIMKIIITEIFQVKDNEILSFDNYELEEMYHHIDWTDINNVYHFFEKITKRTKKINPTINTIRMKGLVTKRKNSYYKPF